MGLGRSRCVGGSSQHELFAVAESGTGLFSSGSGHGFRDNNRPSKTGPLSLTPDQMRK